MKGCIQHMTNSDVIDRIFHFLANIGISVSEKKLPKDTFLPGVTIETGAILIDRQQLKYPGDILHEAGHIAVAPPSIRSGMTCNAGEDAGEEIAAQAWSYAAAVACGVEPELVFHEGGYHGQGPGLADIYRQGGWPGVPLLAWYGLTGMPQMDPNKPPDLPRFPEMKAWLRDLDDPTERYR